VAAWPILSPACYHTPIRPNCRTKELSGARVVAAAGQPLTVQAFQAKWQGVTLTERSASQSHFNDLCHMLEVPTPTDAHPTGSFYTFERGAEKSSGGAGPDRHDRPRPRMSTVRADQVPQRPRSRSWPR
jgi:hypothetical protein